MLGWVDFCIAEGGAGSCIFSEMETRETVFVPSSMTARSLCPTFACFWLSRHVVRSPAGASGVGSRSTDEWECGRRDQRGCPEVPTPSDPPAYRQRGGAWEAIEGAVRQ